MMKKIFIGIITIMVIMNCIPQTNAVTINLDDVYFIVENERYNCSNMSFSSITIGSDYIIFNTTGFFIDAPNDINITLYFINSSMDGIIGDRLINFSANTSGGLVYFNLSGFNVGSNYTVNRTGSWYVNDTANATGFINWTNDDWSNTQFWDIYIKEAITIFRSFIKSKTMRYILISFVPILAGILIFVLLFKRKEKKEEKEEKDMENDERWI